MKIKRYLLAFILLGSINQSVVAQTYRNSVKVNALGLATSLASVQAEWSVSPHFSLIGTGFYRPQKAIPFASKLDNFLRQQAERIGGIKTEYLFPSEMTLGVLGFSPEIRYYIGSRPSRWFVSAFGQYENMKFTLPALLAIPIGDAEITMKMPIDFKANTITGGMLVGRQFRFGERFGLDLVLIGGHVGKANKIDGIIQQNAIGLLDESEKERLRLRTIERFGISEDNFTLTVGNSEAVINAKRPMPYVGLRGAGVNLSYFF